MRDVDDEAAGQRDLGREPRALRLHRVLDGLDEDVLAALDQILDLAGALAALELGADDLVDVEEAVLLEPDLDERGLHARQDVVDDAEVDVAGDRPAFGPLEVDLGDLVVLEHGDALLAGVDGNEQLALRLRQRRPLRRRAPAGRLGERARLALGLLRARPSAPTCSPRPPSVAAVAPPPAAVLFFRLRPPRVPRRRFFGWVVLDCPSRSSGAVADSTVSGSTCGAPARSRGRRLVLRLLASEQGQWQTISPVRSARAQPRVTRARGAVDVGKALA